MDECAPASEREVEELLSQALATVHPSHRARFELIRVPFRRIPVSDDPGAHVIVVAEFEQRVLYYSDIEDGWEWDSLNSTGGIDRRGCNQFKLSHVLHHAFGDPIDGSVT